MCPSQLGPHFLLGEHGTLRTTIPLPGRGGLRTCIPRVVLPTYRSRLGPDHDLPVTPPPMFLLPSVNNPGWFTVT